MSNINELVSLYTEDPRVRKIAAPLYHEPPVSVLLNGCTGAVDSFILAGLFLSDKKSQIYIASDKEDAAYIQNTLQSIFEKKTIHFFPDSFKRPLLFEELDKNNVLLRTEISHKIQLNKGEKTILVTYPEAIFEKVVDPTLLNKQQILITKDALLDIDEVIQILVQYGFERVEFVYQPGQFSIRGGILDIFSYGNEWPYRVELMDIEVESIRTFNPSTQLSVQEINTVSIIPNINSNFSREEKIVLFDIMAPDTVIWVKEPDVLLDKLQLCFEKAENFASTLLTRSEDEIKDIFKERAFVYPTELMQIMGKFHNILLSNPEKSIPVSVSVECKTSPQPAFNKNFSLLIENLRNNTRDGYTNFIFTDNVKQIERFYNIFEDMGVQVQFHPLHKSLHAGFIDHNLKVACYTDHQIFERFHRYKLKQGFTQDMALSLRMLREMVPGDFVVHIDHGIGKYSGLETIEINGHKQESVRLIYQNNDILYVSINSLHKISRYTGKDGTEPKLSKIGSDAWKNLKRKTKSKVKDIAKELIKLYALRKASKGFAFPPDNYLQTELEASFIYEDTPDQYKATQEVKEDMQKPYPMDRLICGDVGFGKTEVAIRAAFKAVSSGKQVALLVPTTILALQHYKTFSERLKEFGVNVEYINRFKSAKEKSDIIRRTEEGKTEILIGTHAILNNRIKFKDLGLLIIDEEQKFGVAAKEKLRNLQVNVDTLTLTATPIPRTLQFSLMAARDLSVIRTPPPNRQPIHTERRVFSEDLIKDAIYYEVNRGGQVFFVHNRVKSLYEMAEMVRKICPDVEVAVAHGQMEAHDLEDTLVDFIDGKYDVLVCTNIIETGLDIPNANTIIINNAHQFGMSDLHQLRGRVGRSNKRAFCYLFAPPLSVLTSDAKKRIKTLEEFADLGSGFQIAMKDMDIRGAGNLLGAEQSGFISDIGYETYQKILEEAVDELKHNEYKELFKEENDRKQNFVREVEIDTDIEMLIPDDYVSNIQERLLLYTQLDKLESESDIDNFRKNLRDRFGKVPGQVEELFNGLRIRRIAKSLGFERVTLKNRKMNCYFISNPQSSYFETTVFQNIMQYVAKEGMKAGFSMKQSNQYLILTKEQTRSLGEAYAHLNNLRHFVLPEVNDEIIPTPQINEYENIYE
ncbi:MAG: transcription-repair coupling factor [Saprospiraceae bacterium]|nr:transcription-repair coupling factor [Saprospiraceae bacterium]